MSIARTLPVALALLCAVPAAVGAQVPADLQTAMKTRDEALVKGDAATWDRLTTEDFTVVGADGRLMTKPERLAQFKATKPTPRGPQEQLQIKRYGDAFVRRFRSGDIWVMDVWAKDPQGWRVGAVQVTTAAGK
jgi:hypothetical protein